MASSVVFQENAFDKQDGHSGTLNRNLWVDPETHKIYSRPAWVRCGSNNIGVDTTQPIPGYVPAGPVALFSVTPMESNRAFNRFFPGSEPEKGYAGSFAVAAGVFPSTTTQDAVLGGAVTYTPQNGVRFCGSFGSAGVPLYPATSSFVAWGSEALAPFQPSRGYGVTKSTYFSTSWINPQNNTSAPLVGLSQEQFGVAAVTGLANVPVYRDTVGFCVVGGRGWVLVRESTPGPTGDILVSTKILFSNPGAPTTFVAGNEITVSGVTLGDLHPVGIVGIDNQYIVIYGDSGTLTYQVTPNTIPLVFRNAAQTGGTGISAFAVPYGENAVFLGHDGLTTASEEVFRDSLRASPFSPEVMTISRYFYQRVRRIKTAWGWGTYSKTLNCLLFTCTNSREGLYVWLGSPLQPPFACLWDMPDLTSVTTGYTGVYCTADVGKNPENPASLAAFELDQDNKFTIGGTFRVFGPSRMWLLETPGVIRSLLPTWGSSIPTWTAQRLAFTATWVTAPLGQGGGTDKSAVEVTDAVLYTHSWRVNPVAPSANIEVIVQDSTNSRQSANTSSPDISGVVAGDFVQATYARADLIPIRDTPGFSGLGGETENTIPVRSYASGTHRRPRITVNLYNAESYYTRMAHVELTLKASRRPTSSTDK